MLFSFLAPLAAAIIQMSISRRREFMADRAGAEFSRNPLYLRDALNKLESYSHNIPMTKQNPAYSHMFIINPLSGLQGLADLFRTHLFIFDRIKELEKMAYDKNLMIQTIHLYQYLEKNPYFPKFSLFQQLILSSLDRKSHV